MTKISIDVDFNNDPESILEEIRQKAKTEVEKREKKERIAAHLENLHAKVNDEIGTSFNNANELIRALAAYATPILHDRIVGVSSTGRRKTVTMTKTLLNQIKGDLEDGSKSKAQVARDAGVSSSQVTKVQRGGYDLKFDSQEIEGAEDEPESITASDQAVLPIPDLEPKQEELSIPEPSPLEPPPPLGVDEAEETDSAEEPKPEGISIEEEAATSEEQSEETPGSFEGSIPPDPAPAIPPPGVPSPELGSLPPPDLEMPSVPAIEPSPDEASEDLAQLDVPDAPPEPVFPPPPPDDTASVAPDEESVSEQGEENIPSDVPPVPESILKPKPSIKLGGKNKPIKLGKGKYSSDVTRPPMGKHRAGDEVSEENP